MIIACATFIKENHLKANQYSALPLKSLAVFERELRDVLCIIDGNVFVVKSLAKICDAPFKGCHSHNLNLGFEFWITKRACFSNAIKFKRVLMTQLQSLRDASRLREVKELGALQLNNTKRKRTYNMIKNFVSFNKLHQSNLWSQPPPAFRLTAKLATCCTRRSEESLKHLHLSSRNRFYDDGCTVHFRWSLPTSTDYVPTVSAIAKTVIQKLFEKVIMKKIDGRERTWRRWMQICASAHPQSRKLSSENRVRQYVQFQKNSG